MKKSVSLLLSLLLILMVSTATAESVVTVSRGSTVSMDVSITSASGTSAKIGIKTNNAPVTFVRAVGGSVNDTVPPQAFNDYFAVVNIEGVSLLPDGTDFSGSVGDYTLSTLVDGVIGTLTFRINDDAELGTYTVEAYKSSGSCTVVGSVIFEVVDRIPGDANNDGKVSAADALLTLKYAANWEVEINLLNADVTADGKVTAVDALNILKYTANWDIELK